MRYGYYSVQTPRFSTLLTAKNLTDAKRWAKKEGFEFFKVQRLNKEELSYFYGITKQAPKRTGVVKNTQTYG